MPYQVEIKSTGHRFTLEENETVLDGALRAGYTLPYGCRNGACGACVGTVVNGKVDYVNRDGVPALSKIDETKQQALFCQAHACEDLLIDSQEVTQGKDIPIKKIPCRLVKMEKLAHDVMCLQLKTPDSNRLQFLAGQYIDFLLKDGRRRSFSLANAPCHDELLELHVRHVDGGEFTDFIFNEMKEKSLLRIEGPLGSFFLRDQDEKNNRPILMLAGGTGFAPIKSLIEQAIYNEDSRQIDFYWGARAKQDLYLHDMATQWAQQDNINYIPVLSEPSPEDNWQGKLGFVHQAVLDDHTDLSGYDAYVCGPPPMVDAAHTEFMQRGLPQQRFFSDSFEFNSEQS